MSDSGLRDFKKRLLAEEHYLVAEIEGQQSELADSAEAAGEERTSAAEDASSQIFEHERTLAVEGAFEGMLAEVRHALHKIDDRSYGLCDECGQPIDYERLQARPQASLCINCKRRDEHAHESHKRLALGRR